MPPVGGFEMIKYKRNLPSRGPGAWVILVGVLGICGYGWSWIHAGIVEKRELEREKMWSRLYLVPMLQAEADRDSYRRDKAMLSRETEIMKDVKGWKVGESVYNKPRPGVNRIVVL